MSESTPDESGQAQPGEYGSLTAEDDPAGTVNPGELAGTASDDDASVGYEPTSGEGPELEG